MTGRLAESANLTEYSLGFWRQLTLEYYDNINYLCNVKSLGPRYLFRKHSWGQKRFTFSLRRTVEKCSVPFPLYGLGMRSAYGHDYGCVGMVMEQTFLFKRTFAISPRATAVSLRLPVEDDEDQRCFTVLIMHLSMLSPTSPLLGNSGDIVGI